MTNWGKNEDEGEKIWENVFNFSILHIKIRICGNFHENRWKRFLTHSLRHFWLIEAKMKMKMKNNGKMSWIFKFSISKLGYMELFIKIWEKGSFEIFIWKGHTRTEVSKVLTYAVICKDFQNLRFSNGVYWDSYVGPCRVVQATLKRLRAKIDLSTRGKLILVKLWLQDFIWLVGISILWTHYSRYFLFYFLQILYNSTYRSNRQLTTLKQTTVLFVHLVTVIIFWFFRAFIYIYIYIYL